MADDVHNLLAALVEVHQVSLLMTGHGEVHGVVIRPVEQAVEAADADILVHGANHRYTADRTNNTVQIRLRCC